MGSNLTLGSLFDGSGGFPLGGLITGVTPVWASEIEPFPIRVTTKRLPFMKHYGDVSRLNGAVIEPVDIITFGSPCQDMSVAGRRAGLGGSRSNLFYEAIRIAKEMREATNGLYPTWLCWENVPGAFSSNAGADFKAVLDEIRKIKEPEADTPRPARWPNAGCIMADDHSIAWRVFDAQYWGVPQRRKRIYLVADLAGQRAGKVLFESEGLSGYTPQGFSSWQRAAGTAEEGSNTSGGRLCLNDQGGQFMDVSDDVAGTLRSQMDGHPPVVMDTVDAIVVGNHPTDSRVTVYKDGKVQTLTSRMGTGGNNVPLVMKIRCGCEGGGKGPLIQRDRSATLSTNNDQTLFVPCNGTDSETLVPAKCIKPVTQPVYSTSKNSYHTEARENLANTLVATDFKDPPIVSGEPDYIVRRLTPKECARLQGFPDWWCAGLDTPSPDMEDIKYWYDVFEEHRLATGIKAKPKTCRQIEKWLRDPYSDSAEYRMWGNGVALPCVCFVMSGIAYYASQQTN